MKLIYVSHWRYPAEKASPRIAIKTCEVYATMGFDVELWVPWRSNKKFRGVDPYAYHHVERNFSIKRLAAVDLTEILPGSFGYYLMVATFNISVMLYALIRRVYRSAIFYSLDIRDMVLLNFFNPIVFYEIHDFYKLPVGWLNRWSFRKGIGVAATNRMKLANFMKEFGIPQEKMLHKPCPVAVSFFNTGMPRDEARKQKKLPYDEKIIVYCGQVLLWKGVDGLIAADKYLNPGEVIYVVVGGDQATIDTFKAKCREIGTKNIHVIEGELHHDIPVWLRAADVLVLPNTGRDYVSRHDTSPLKLLEYMAAGRPIVSADLPSVRNLVDESMVWFYEADNPKAMADAIHTAFREKEEVQEKCRRAQEEVKQYDWQERLGSIRQYMLKAIQ